MKRENRNAKTEIVLEGWGVWVIKQIGLGHRISQMQYNGEPAFKPIIPYYMPKRKIAEVNINVQNLPKDERRAVSLRFSGDERAEDRKPLKQKEVSQIMGISQSTVSRLLGSGYKILRKKITWMP